MAYNRTYLEGKACAIDRDLAKFKKNHPKLKKILLDCGDGTGSKTFTSSNEAAFQLAFVTLDTICLNKSKVLIKFSSIVNMERLIDGATVRLQYELFRVGDDEAPKSLGIWMFEEVDVDAFSRQEESFSFIFCDPIVCPGCLAYFVVVTPIEIDGATATVSNGRMAALSQSIFDSLEKGYEGVKCKKKHPTPKDIVLQCGQGNGSIILREESEIKPPFEIAHVTLDTSCLRTPKVLIEFSSIIKLNEGVEDVRLQFELLRVCGNGEAVSCGNWTFERTGVIDNEDLEKVFDFIFCQYEAPSSCCEYFVRVTPLKIDINQIAADIVVDNARIVALAQSLGDVDDYKIFYGKNDSIDCELKSPTAKKILLECGEGTGSRIFTSSNELAFQLAHVNINTTCLCKPKVNIEFSSIVTFDRLLPDSDARLRYELFRVCSNKSPISLGVWVLERVRGGTQDIIGKSTNIFNFTFCDCISCPDCCEYFVTVTPIQITEGFITVTVSTGKMAALAQEGNCNHGYMKNDYYKLPMCSTKWEQNPDKMEKILLECGQGSGKRTFTSSKEGSFQLAYVTLDNIFKNGQKVLIKFSSIVRMDNLAIASQESGTVRLQYELFRGCDYQALKSLGIWMFEEVNVDFAAFSQQEESFSFIFCDPTPCPDCCDYFVTVTPIEIDRATATVSNGRMAALSQTLWGCLKEEYKISNLKYCNSKFRQNFSKPKEIVLTCGQGNGSVVFRRDSAGTIELDPPVGIAHITIDTTHLKKPNVLIEFSSMIKFDDGIDSIRLQFELFRTCGNQKPLSRGIWNFERTDVNEFIELTKAFDFIFCECEIPEGCCEYFVTVTPLEIDVDILGADVVLDNARIVALVQSSGELNNCKIINEKSGFIAPMPKCLSTEKTVLECGQGAGSRTFRSSKESAFQIANVTIDTTCFCNPIVNIEFSSIVSFDRIVGSADGRLRYELFRVYNNREPISLGIWVSERIGISFFDKTTNIFNFTFCDCITCPGCCDYFVTVTPIRISEGELTVTVSNGRIVALAQEG